MKTVVTKLFFVFFIFSASLYAQYFIDEDIIREHRNSQNESYLVPPERYEEKKVFLMDIMGRNGMKTNVYIGFDKTEYKKGDEILLTFKRDNDIKYCDIRYNVSINPATENDISFSLEQGETKNYNFKIPVAPAVKDFFILRINIWVDKVMYNETIVYGIIMDGDSDLDYEENDNDTNRLRVAPPSKNKIQSDSTKPKIKTLKLPLKDSGQYVPKINTPRKNGVNQPDNNNMLESAAIFTGRITYTDIFTGTDTRPVNHWYYLLYESDDSVHLYGDTIPPTAGYPVVGNNGVFNTTLTVNKNYFKIEFYLQRVVIENNAERRIYATGQLVTSEDSIALYGLPTLPHKKPTGVIVTFNYNYDQSSELIYETLRRCAHIGNRLDEAVKHVLDGDSISKIQELRVGTRSNHPDEYMASTIPMDKLATPPINVIKFGRNVNVILKDRVIWHEHGHSVFYIPTEYNQDDGGSPHYMDGKNRTTLAFSEGWANFWAAAVLDSPAIHNIPGINLNLETVDKSYIYSLTTIDNTYLPDCITPYDGPENEGLIAAAFWKMKIDNSFSAVYAGLKNKIQLNEYENVQNFLDYLTVNQTLKNSFYSNPNRTEELGFGRNFTRISINDTLSAIFQNADDKDMLYITDGEYNVNNVIEIENISFGLYGRGIKRTIVKSTFDPVGAGNTIFKINSSNTNNDWIKISDLRIRNANYLIDALGNGQDRTKIYLSRCFLTEAYNIALRLNGNSVLFNNAICNNPRIGISLENDINGSKIYFYNNVLDSDSLKIYFNNSATIAGYISNNMFSSDGEIISYNPLAPANSLSNLNFSYNGLDSAVVNSILGLNVSNNYDYPPDYDLFIYLNKNNLYKDAGLNPSSSPDFYDPIFNDLLLDFSINGNAGIRNWVGFYGGQQALRTHADQVQTKSDLTIYPGEVLTENQIWSGEVIMNNEVEISDTLKVLILPGTELKSIRLPLTVKNGGSINTTSWGNKKVTFDFGLLPTMGPLPSFGIKVIGPTSSANLRNTVIKKADIGIEVDQGQLLLDNSEIKENWIGLYIHNTNSESEQISNVQILNSKIYDNESIGIALSEASPTLMGNEIYNNYSYGVSAISNSSPLFGEIGVNGFNNMYSQSVVLYSHNSDPILGIYDPPLNTAGYNSIIGEEYHIFAERYSDVYGQLNWWGTDEPEKEKMKLVDSKIDYDPWLMSSPFEFVNKPVNSVANADEPEIQAPVDPRKLLKEARKLLLKNRRNEARQIAKTIIKNYSNSEFSVPALRLLKNAVKTIGEKDSLKIYLQSFISAGQSKPVFAFAKIMLADLIMDNYIQRMDEVIVEHPDNDIIPYVLFKKITYYYHEENDIDEARVVLAQMKNEYPELRLTEIAQSLFGEKGENRLGKIGTISSYQLYNNYPNPFNPSTIIRYQIPKAGIVTLKVYDILGREVSTLINDLKPAGQYEVNFDASTLASGVYIYRLQAGDYVSSKKMLLVK